MKKFIQLIFGHSDNVVAEHKAKFKAIIEVPPVDNINTNVIDVIEIPPPVELALPTPPVSNFDKNENENLNTIFQALLLDPKRINAAMEMLRSGHILNMRSAFLMFHAIMYPNLVPPMASPELKTIFKEAMLLTFDSMRQGLKEGLVYPVETPHTRIKVVDKLMFLFEMLAKNQDVEKLNALQKIEYINKYKSYLAPFDSNPQLIEPFYTQALERIDYIEGSLNQSVADINQGLKNRQMINSLELSAALSQSTASLSGNILAQKCNLLNQKIKELSIAYRLSPEDKITLTNLVSTDIPNLIKSQSFPVEIANKYEVITGQKFAESLADLATKYELLVSSLEEKYTLAAAHSIHQGVQSSHLYLDKKRESLAPSSSFAPPPIVPLKTLKSGKL